MRFSRQEYWSGLPFPTPGDLPDPGIEPTSPVLAGGFLLLSHLGMERKLSSEIVKDYNCSRSVTLFLQVCC